ncbi:probable G-protein coupled receptor 158 [Cryptotermes secundus]|uniref:probable G-protein coupled receptor 158 n=1 Tax=Cryptotermes secundus TaxID=105785 RepID=UPI001454BD9F|nr:probable G-protein coupled receptor 158 [Cryptotermes secundus]XP_033608558.1 probable G-protein coupled receptor 158 [Cryptotermes secundus]
MKASLLVLLLVAVRAVIGGTNRSLLPDDTELLGSCVPTVLEGVLLSAGNLPDRVVNLKPVAMQAAQEVAGGVRDVERLLMLKLKEHRVLTAIAVSLSRPPENATVIYRSGDDSTRVHRLSNLSSLVDTTWRTVLDADWNQSSKASDVTELWTPPFLDCLTRKWLFGYSVSLHRGAAGIFFPVDEHLDIHQCNETFSSIFGGGHRCDQDTAECVPAKGPGLRRGYTCTCRLGYFSQDSDLTKRHFRGEEGDADETLYKCVPCPDGCDVCGGDSPCMARHDYLLRTVVLGVQILCMCITVVLAIVVFKQRKCKTIASGMWTVLETILLGIFLLYSTVIVRFFDPSVEQCLLEPWCRELGFVICYGAIILKLYRILIEFRTRKAHRWVVRDKDLLKYLLGMVLVVFGYMAAWTVTNLNFIQENYDVLTVGTTYEGLQFLACKALWWDYVTETGEILILVFGIHLSYACRNATTQFQERRFLCFAIIVEATVSGAFYVLRILYSRSLHPDFSFLAYFTRSQLTSTVVLLVIFTPKLWYQHKQVTDSRGKRHYEYSCPMPVDAFKPRDGITGTNSSDVDVGEINLADMNPEDIRAELKRLYTQLEVLKNKTIRADNPHISKRRGGRKVAHRRFSLQKKGSREKALHNRHQRCSTRHYGTAGGGATDHEATEAEVSRTPEDSVCSIEGPSAIYNDGPSTFSEVGFGTPNVSYRMAHKQ